MQIPIFTRPMLAIMAVVVLPLSSQPLQAAPTIEDYGKLPDIEAVSISPDGKRKATISTVNGKRMLLVIDGDSAKSLEVGNEKIRSLAWATNSLLMLTFSQIEQLSERFTTDQSEMYRTLFVNPDNGLTKKLFEDNVEIAPIFAGFHGFREIDNRRFGFLGGIPKLKVADTLWSKTFYEYRGGQPALYKIDFANFAVSEVAPPPRVQDTRDWAINAAGELVAILTVSEDGNWSLTDGNWRYVKGRYNYSGKGYAKELATGKNKRGNVIIAGLAGDGSKVVIGEQKDEDDGYKYTQIDLKTATAKPFLPGVDVDSFYIGHLTGIITGYSTDNGEQDVFFDPAMQEWRSKIKNAFPNLEYDIIDYDDQFSKVLVSTSGNGDSGTYWEVDLQRLKADPLGYAYPNIEPDDVGKISTVTYNATDGLEIEGVLTLPPKKEAKNLPVIILPHGGPRSHDEPKFDWWAQAFAMRGYAVFQPNFRGSTNKDTAFMKAGDGEWGKKMQADVSDGLAHLAKQGIVDPRRACIVGASYGGYAALAGVTLQQGLYRCAVSVAGVADLPLLVSTERRESGYNEMLVRGLKEQVGSGRDLKAVSPRAFAAEADAPILLIHGKDDTVVPLRQSEVMAEALKTAGKPHELIVLDGEDHWLSRGETRLQMLQATISFVEKHNPAN